MYYQLKRYQNVYMFFITTITIQIVICIYSTNESTNELNNFQ